MRNEIEEEYFLHSTSYTKSLKTQGTKQFQTNKTHNSINDKFYSSNIPPSDFCLSYISLITLKPMLFYVAIMKNKMKYITDFFFKLLIYKLRYL